ncbi:MAG TPA: SCP2 sterol-binding domain-containing protein [Spirochaetia bacterium]|nr:SCP2 sterol-binding domain-containing protein [Spirochaetia bacterium]
MLDQFVDLLRKSEVFRRESRRGEFSALLHMRDPQAALFLMLKSGRVLAGAGADASTAQRAAFGVSEDVLSPTLGLHLPATTLHEVLIGDVHPMQLALSGRVRVSGNMLAAIGLQSLLPEAIRLYRAAYPATIRTR